VSAKTKAGSRTRDAFLGGRVTLVQPREGHRAGLDAALLQALVPASASGVAVDLGSGVGTVAFSIAARAPGLSAIGIERDADLVACGRAALKLSANTSFANRVRLIAADASNAEAVRNAVSSDADFVLMNPPFDTEGSGRRSPDARRRQAHLAADGLLQAWLATAAAILRPGGTVALIHRAEALTDVLAALAPRFGAIRVLAVHPKAGAKASRILVGARRGRRTPLAIAPPLVLHAPNGTWTAEADAVLRGEAELAAPRAN
jgi:tRNA1(Val) A37 N6-methylase TrmN6